jgi:hypothetical protein
MFLFYSWLLAGKAHLHFELLEELAHNIFKLKRSKFAEHLLFR